MNNNLPLVVLAVLAACKHPRAVAVAVPQSCNQCLYRQPEWRDGGHCYMFREMPNNSCAQFKKP
jgi:predicted acyl esterase